MAKSKSIWTAHRSQAKYSTSLSAIILSRWTRTAARPSGGSSPSQNLQIPKRPQVRLGTAGILGSPRVIHRVSCIKSGDSCHSDGSAYSAAKRARLSRNYFVPLFAASVGLSSTQRKPMNTERCSGGEKSCWLREETASSVESFQDAPRRRTLPLSLFSRHHS